MEISDRTKLEISTRSKLVNKQAGSKAAKGKQVHEGTEHHFLPFPIFHSSILFELPYLALQRLQMILLPKYLSNSQ